MWGEVGKEIWGSGVKDRKSFSVYDHTLCLTKNLPFCLEYCYFFLICSRRCIYLLFLFLLINLLKCVLVGGVELHRYEYVPVKDLKECSNYLKFT